MDRHCKTGWQPEDTDSPQDGPTFSSHSSQLSIKGTQARGSPKLSKQEPHVPEESRGKQDGYSEGLAPSVGHSGNCLSAEPAAESKKGTYELARWGPSGKKLSPFCPLKHPERPLAQLPLAFPRF